MSRKLIPLLLFSRVFFTLLLLLYIFFLSFFSLSDFNSTTQAQDGSSQQLQLPILKHLLLGQSSSLSLFLSFWPIFTSSSSSVCRPVRMYFPYFCACSLSLPIYRRFKRERERANIDPILAFLSLSFCCCLSSSFLLLLLPLSSALCCAAATASAVIDWFVLGLREKQYQTS